MHFAVKDSLRLVVVLYAATLHNQVHCFRNNVYDRDMLQWKINRKLYVTY